MSPAARATWVIRAYRCSPKRRAVLILCETSAFARRRQLRELDGAIVADLVHVTGKAHAAVNTELNRHIGSAASAKPPYVNCSGGWSWPGACCGAFKGTIARRKD
jgi:hypothetical protein